MLVFAHIHQIVILARPIIAGLEVQDHPLGSAPFQLKLLLVRNPEGCESYARATLCGLLSTVQAASNQCVQLSCQRRVIRQKLEQHQVSGEDEPADKEELRKGLNKSARTVGLAFRISWSTTLNFKTAKRIGTWCNAGNVCRSSNLHRCLLTW